MTHCFLLECCTKTHIDDYWRLVICIFSLLCPNFCFPVVFRCNLSTSYIRIYGWIWTMLLNRSRHLHVSCQDKVKNLGVWFDEGLFLLSVVALVSVYSCTCCISSAVCGAIANCNEYVFSYTKQFHFCDDASGSRLPSSANTNSWNCSTSSQILARDAVSAIVYERLSCWEEFGRYLCSNKASHPRSGLPSRSVSFCKTEWGQRYTAIEQTSPKPILRCPWHKVSFKHLFFNVHLSGELR